MRRTLGSGIRITFMLFFMALYALGQSSGGNRGGSTGSPSTTPSTTTRPTQPSIQPREPFRGPIFISGRVISELGTPISEPVSVELNCGMRPVQVIHTDLGGYFTFNLGSGAQSNIDFSASNETPQTFNSSAPNFPSRYGNPLAGCEVRISVAGFHPKSLPLAHTTEMGRLDIGNVILQRIGEVKGSAVSVTSLMVPKDATKEFEKAVKDLRKNKFDSAQPHLEKAVKIYDQYAAAWNELGRLYVRRNDRARAEQAFQKATAADSEYIPPLVNLATLQIQNQQWEQGVQTAEKVLELDPSIGFADFLKAVGEYNLNHLDEAERSAQAAEKAPHENNPQVHALLAQIYMTRQDYPHAAEHMQSYLKESPDGRFAERMKKDLAEIEEWLSGSGTSKDNSEAVAGQSAHP